MVQPDAELYVSAALMFEGEKLYIDDRNHEESRQTLKCSLCGGAHVTS